MDRTILAHAQHRGMHYLVRIKDIGPRTSNDCQLSLADSRGV